MTIWYPDVSNHNGEMTLEAGTVAVFAKATEGTTFTDKFYAHFKGEASRVGAVFGAYHFLHRGDGAAQARHCFSVVGAGVSVMVDCEPTTGSNPTVQDVVDFVTEYRALGGLVSLVYLPKWYWKNLGSPSLAKLTALKLGLVSSAYPGSYSDTGEGWSRYGTDEPVPAVWQYTDKLSYAGQSVDFNAYRGTVEEFKTLLGYTTKPTSSAATMGDDLTYLISVTPDPTQEAGNKNAGIFIVDGGTVVHVDPGSYGPYHSKFGDPLVVDTTQYAALLAASPAATSNTVNTTIDAAALATALGPAIASALAAHVGIAFTAK